MREIKFRAWDEKSKRMFNVDVLAISPVMWDSGGTGVSLAYQPHIKVMQYTGLKDKNGKEIYEGDIVRIKGHALQRDKRGIGIDIDGNYVVKWSEKMELILAPSPELKEGWLLSKNLHYIEVIGNIYENPELLEGTV